MTLDPHDQAAIARYFGCSHRVAQLIAKVDWRSHPLGPPDGWPLALRIVLRNLLASPEALYVVWGENQSFFFNDAYIPFLKTGLEHATGARFDDLFAEFYETLAPLYRKALAGEATRIVNQPVRTLRSSTLVERWWTLSFAPLYGDEGAIDGVQCQTDETTEHMKRIEAEKRVAAALLESERGLRRAQEAGQIGIFTIEIASNTIVGNPEFYRLFGLPEEPMLASAIEAMVVTEDAHIISHEAERKAETIDLHVEYRIHRPDNGEIRYIERRGEFERDEQGRAIRLVGVVQDVTERRAAQSALAELNATLEARVKQRTAERNLFARIVEETDNLVFVLDNDYRWLAINRAGAAEFERNYGNCPRAGDTIQQSLGHQTEGLARIEAMWARALAGEEYTTIVTFGDPALVSELHTYEMKFNVLRDEEGKQIGAIQVASDVSERVRAETDYRQMQEALRQSQKMEAMGQLTGGVAHDFNNLLTPIIGSLDLLQRRSTLSDRETRLIDGALQSAERAKTLVQRLLAFARRQPLQTGPVEVAKLIEGMAELLASTSGPQIKIRSEVPGALPPALGDHNQLEMAILNLCVNARDAMPDGGTLTIAARAETAAASSAQGLAPGPYICLSVVDTGSGMDEETLARAVEPFYSTKGIGKGTGLGLSMVHGLALQLGGTMTITSERGLGTRVDLWLPVSKAAPAGGRNPPEEKPAAGFRGRALVVDDELLVRIATADMLQGLGYDTEEAENGRDAVRMLRSGRRFDLVVTDHLMPGLSGAELTMTIRRHWPGLPVLIVSGYADAETIAPDMARLAKPFREAELARAIGELC